MNKSNIIKKCEELMRSFNPVTHSIDTYCLEKLGDTTKSNASPENVFVQQVLYGWYRQRPGIKCFIENFYADNASRALRTDNILYSIFAYISIFRLEELGFISFKEFVLTQDPLKMFNFMNYLFNKENLWSCLRADWMKVYDLEYVEDELIAGIENYMTEAKSFLEILQEKAQGLAAAMAEKQKALDSGTYGLKAVAKKSSTRPISPNITKPHAPIIPEPQKISTKVVVTEMPSYLDRTSLATIEEKRKQQLEEARKATLSKYDESYHFKLSETKGGRPLEEIQKEVEEMRTKDIDFNKSFMKKPPDFNKIPAKIRLNVAAILREDALYKKKQAQDAQILKAYEEDLRDPSEYYAWLNEMKARDEEIKLKQVALRRDLAKQSAIEAKVSMERQRDDNKAVAELMREQAEAIREQRNLEEEIRALEVQEQVIQIAIERKRAPKEAKEKVLADKEEQSKQLRDELEAARRRKEEEDRIAEEIKADKIRQLRAENTILKKNVVVFDPTESSGIGLLDEMSYMEMKERLEAEKKREESNTLIKRQEILEEKEKKAKDLEDRTQSIIRARQVKAEANSALRERKRDQELQKIASQITKKETSAVVLDDELNRRREEKKREADMLKAEVERVRRQQQYLGAAKGQVEENRAQQQLLGREREAAELQAKLKREAEHQERCREVDKSNRVTVIRKEKTAKSNAIDDRDREVLRESKAAVEKLKKEVLRKKMMFKEGTKQHEKTKGVIVDHNPYAARISEDSLKTVHLNRA